LGSLCERAFEQRLELGARAFLARASTGHGQHFVELLAQQLG
jgi:hypothetical protein